MVSADLGGGRRGAAHADPAADQGAEHGEEAPGVVLDRAGVGAVRRDLAVAVQQHVPRHRHVVEAEPAVVHAEQAGLGAGVADGHAGQRVAVRVADRHQPRVYAVPPPAGDQLREDHGHPAVPGRVADVVLAGRLVRGVQVEGLRPRVVRAGGAQLLDVGAVAGLGHREAAEDPAGDDVPQVGVVVPPGAEGGDGAAEQAPLHARLDHQRQVDLGQHLGGDDRGAHVGAAAVLGGEGRRDSQLDGKFAEQPGDPLACLVAGLAVHREETRVEVVAVRVADGGPRAVEHVPQVGEVDMIRHCPPSVSGHMRTGRTRSRIPAPAVTKVGRNRHRFVV